MLNRYIGIGVVGKEPEIRSTPSGKQVASFTLAVKPSYSKETLWLNQVEGWENIADYISNYVHKGDTVSIEAGLYPNTWQDKNGNKRYDIKFRIDNINKLHSSMSKSENTVSGSSIAGIDNIAAAAFGDELPF